MSFVLLNYLLQVLEATMFRRDVNVAVFQPSVVFHNVTP
jgi:hypothetical protein